MSKLRLEFRNHEGTYLFDFVGERTLTIFNELKSYPNFIHKTKRIKDKGDIVVLECIEDCSFVLGFTSFCLFKGGYVKCIYK
jgi:hypothetical protein